jgi:hypothetical protein
MQAVNFIFFFINIKKKKLNTNIASIFITLTEINNETHYVPKQNQNKTKQQKQQKNKTKLLR